MNRQQVLDAYGPPAEAEEVKRGEPYHCQRYKDRPKCKMLVPVECPFRLTCWLVVLLSGEQPQTVYMASLLIGCSTEAVRYYVRSGKLRPLAKISGVSGVYFNIDEVMRFKQERDAQCKRT